MAIGKIKFYALLLLCLAKGQLAWGSPELKTALRKWMVGHHIGNILVKRFDQDLEQALPSEKLFGQEYYQKLLGLYQLQHETKHLLTDIIKKDYPRLDFKLLNLDEITLINEIISEEIKNPQYQKIDTIPTLPNLPLDEAEIKQFEQNIPLIKAYFDPPEPGLRYYPSLGKTGNLTGNEFPLDTWALTFDDGPHRERTLLILAELQKHQMPANFFALASLAQEHPGIALAEKNLGHTLANHSFTHPQLNKLNPTQLFHEIVESTKVLESIWQTHPDFFRCPYGAGVTTERIRLLIAQEKMIHIFWNVDSLDWQDKNPQSVFERTVKQIEINQKGIILFHDIHAQTVIASAMVMNYLKEKKLNVASLRTIIDHLNSTSFPPAKK